MREGERYSTDAATAMHWRPQFWAWDDEETLWFCSIFGRRKRVVFFALKKTTTKV
jgi:hypothetical protein